MDVFLRIETPVLTDYLRHIFPVEGGTDLCTVSSTHPFGALLIAHCQTSPLPTTCKGKGELVHLSLPLLDSTLPLRNKWLYFSAASTTALNAALKAIFELDLQTYYLKATSLGFKKKDIIEGFVSSRGLVTVDPTDAIHKRIYRREQEQLVRITKILTRKINYITESVEMDGLPTPI